MGAPPRYLRLEGPQYRPASSQRVGLATASPWAREFLKGSKAFFFFFSSFFFFRSVGIGGILGCATRKKHSIFLSCHVWTAIKTKASDWLCVQCLCKHYNGYKTSDKRRPDANKITHSLDQLYDSITTAILVLCALWNQYRNAISWLAVACRD